MKDLWPNSEVEHTCETDCQCWFAKIRKLQHQARRYGCLDGHFARERLDELNGEITSLS